MANTSNESNYRMRFHKQCDYLVGFKAKRRISELILLWKWFKKKIDTKDGAYETLVFAYNKKLNLIISTSSITKSDVEEESSPPYLEDAMMDSKEEMMNSKDTTSIMTP